MRRFPVLAAVLSAAALAASASEASSLRFHGNGVAAPGLDRVKIAIDETGNADPGPPADLGAGDFTIEFWMKAAAAENPASPVSCGENIAWIEGNIVVDRDRFNQGRKFGLSLAGGKVVFGASSDSTSRTVCGSAAVTDNAWHHVAVTRDAGSGALAIWVDGVLDGSGPGPVGDLSYPDDGVPCANCCGGGNCNSSDPFLVLGAEKHDAGTEYPAYSGFLDELRLSDSIRYAAPFAPAAAPLATDASTLALYHFDEGAGDAILDSSAHPGGPSDGTRHYGGTPSGPEWTAETPFGDPDDLDSDGKLNTADECTVLLGSQGFARTKLGLGGLGSGAGAQAIQWKGSFRPATGSAVDPSADGLHLRVADGAGELLDVDIPAGLVGASPSTPCDARDGWTSSGTVFQYRNYSGFLDAACSVPAEGVSQVKLLDQTSSSTPRVRFQVRASGSTFAVQEPVQSLEASVALSARPSPGVASAAAQQGACGDQAWDPVTFGKPLPACKAAPATGASTKLLCRTP